MHTCISVGIRTETVSRRMPTYVLIGIHYKCFSSQVDTLNDDIRVLKQENKKAFAERMKLEAQKNKLENLLTNNLNRRKDELVQALQEISVEDRKRQLENTGSESPFTFSRRIEL